MTLATGTFTAEDRGALLRDHIATETALDDAQAAEREAAAAEQARIGRHIALFARRLSTLAERYAASLPLVNISRCPFTGEVLARSIDHGGLDGLWWRHHGAVRREDLAPLTFVGLTGAVRLASPVGRTPFLVKPGPGVPFVIPRLFEGTQIAAVISALAIGPHIGFATSYFSRRPEPVDPPNDWGLDHARWPGGGWSQAFDEDSYDYDVARWIEASRVRWIDPDDATLTLREGATDCPYIGLEGARRPQRIQNGEVW